MVDTKGGHVCHSPQYPPTLVQDSDSDSGASSSGGGCSVSGLVGEINVHVCAIFSAQQSHSEITCHPRSSLSNTDCSLYWWPSQPWFPDLLRLCVDHPMNLSILPRLSQQDQKFISDGKSYHLHAWRLSCNITKQQDFQTRSLGLSQHLGDPQPIACTTTGGFTSLTGPQGKDLICLIPQLLK